MLNILGKRYYFFALSCILIIPGLILLALNGMPLSIDFKGGTLMEIQFKSGVVPTTAQVKSIYNEFGIQDAQIQTTGSDELIIRSSELSQQNQKDILAKLTEISASELLILRSDTVGPSIGKGVTTRAAEAVAVASIAVVLYIAFAFRGVPHAFGYGICAIIAMIHDVFIVLAITGYGAVLFGWQVDSLYLTAVLTIIGFSVQDTIVVFDRIRENTSIYRKLDFEKLVNHSIVQTLQRSINTQLMTVEFFLLALALFGGITLREFCIILLIGMISGTYSSIFIAAPVFVVWDKQEWKTWFKRTPKEA
ncbi:MAG: protein translocase subunit SecF [Chloroflexi bacterium]|nr:protein translocase subunit SecF [Chloroflexota bacterium]